MKAVIADLPGLVSVGATVISAGFNSITRAERMTMTGDVQELDFRVVLAIADLDGAPVPKEGDRVVAQPPGKAAVNCRVGQRTFPQDGGKSVILELAIDRRNPFPQAPILVFGDAQIDFGKETLAYGGIET